MIARYRNPGGQQLTTAEAVVELLNIARTVVAVARFVAFEALGYRFRPGLRVLLGLYGTNHDPGAWEDPESFRPERTRRLAQPLSSGAMADVFSVRIKVRGYELDTQGHLNWAEYLHYAEYARWECLAAAGITQDGLLATGFGPVVLDVSVKFRRELRGGDQVDVSCAFVFDGGPTYGIVQDFRRPDGRVAASLTSTTGLLDLRERKLTRDPEKHFRGLAANPALLGLA